MAGSGIAAGLFQALAGVGDQLEDILGLTPEAMAAATSLPSGAADVSPNGMARAKSKALRARVLKAVQDSDLGSAENILRAALPRAQGELDLSQGELEPHLSQVELLSVLQEALADDEPPLIISRAVPGMGKTIAILALAKWLVLAQVPAIIVYMLPAYVLIGNVVRRFRVQLPDVATIMYCSPDKAASMGFDAQDCVWGGAVEASQWVPPREKPTIVLLNCHHAGQLETLEWLRSLAMFKDRHPGRGAGRLDGHVPRQRLVGDSPRLGRASRACSPWPFPAPFPTRPRPFLRAWGRFANTGAWGRGARGTPCACRASPSSPRPRSWGTMGGSASTSNSW